MVLFPAPVCPTTATTCPGCISNESPFKVGRAFASPFFFEIRSPDSRKQHFETRSVHEVAVR